MGYHGARTDGTMKLYMFRRPETMLTAYLILLLVFTFVTFSCSDESIDQSKNPSPVDPEPSEDEDIYLDDMTDIELEKICTSRGFELVREYNATTGEPLEYTHQDYVDAASECLQIEADLEEILTSHPEILEDVKRESERMMQERDRLQEQLNQIQSEESAKDEQSESASPWGLRKKGSEDLEGGALEPDQSNIKEHSSTDTATETFQSEKVAKPTEPIFDFKEITLEVIDQIKHDITKLINIIVPKTLRDQIAPSLKTFRLIVKDSVLSICDIVKRYGRAILDKKTGSSDSGLAKNNLTEEVSSHGK